MRHGSGLRKLNRTSAHRLAMLRNMTVSLLDRPDTDAAAAGDEAAKGSKKKAEKTEEASAA